MTAAELRARVLAMVYERRRFFFEYPLRYNREELALTVMRQTIEECAKVCDQFASVRLNDAEWAGEECAERIRALAQAEG